MLLVYNPTRLNKSMDTNRRQLSLLGLAGNFEGVVHASSCVSAAVGHLSCSALESLC